MILKNKGIKKNIIPVYKFKIFPKLKILHRILFFCTLSSGLYRFFCTCSSELYWLFCLKPYYIYLGKNFYDTSNSKLYLTTMGTKRTLFGIIKTTLKIKSWKFRRNEIITFLFKEDDNLFQKFPFLLYIVIFTFFSELQKSRNFFLFISQFFSSWRK